MVTYHGWGWGERIDGTDSADNLFGHGGDDDIFGKDGNDFLQGHGGNDRLFGGADNDVLVSGLRDPFLNPTAMFGVEVPDGGEDELNGGSGDDRLIVTMDTSVVDVDGGSDNDTLQMGSDNGQFDEFVLDHPEFPAYRSGEFYGPHRSRGRYGQVPVQRIADFGRYHRLRGREHRRHCAF